MAQGVPGRLRPRIFLTFGTTRVVVRQPYTPAVFTPGEIPGTHFQRLSRPHGTWFCRWEPRKKSPVTPPGIDPGTSRLVVQCLNHYATPGWIKNRYIRSVCLCLSVNITFKKETENGTTSPKNMTPAVWAHIYWGRSLELSYIGSVCLSASLLHLFCFYIRVYSICRYNYMLTCPSVCTYCTFNATYVCTQPQVWSVYFSVSQSLLCKYILHTHDNRICPSLRKFIVSIFPSVRVLSSVSPHVYCVYLFIRLSVHLPRAVKCSRRIQCFLISFWQPNNMSGPLRVVPLWIRKVSVSNLGLKTVHQWPSFPKIYCC